MKFLDRRWSRCLLNSSREKTNQLASSLICGWNTNYLIYLDNYPFPKINYCGLRFRKWLVILRLMKIRHFSIGVCTLILFCLRKQGPLFQLVPCLNLSILRKLTCPFDKKPMCIFAVRKHNKCLYRSLSCHWVSIFIHGPFRRSVFYCWGPAMHFD